MKNTAAFNLFKSGRSDEALRKSIASIKSNESLITETPYSQCKLLSATWLYLSGRKKQAYNEVLGLMKLGLDSVEIRALMLLILGKKSRDDRVPFIFGLGTGRSGSTSLTETLSYLPNSFFSHEHPSIIPFENGEEIVDWHLDRMRCLSTNYDLVGDVSHWWLPYVKYIKNEYPNSFFIIIKRKRIATVGSFLKIKGGGGKGSINHWNNHDGIFYKKNYWDICYPKFSSEFTLKEALEAYWDDYYLEAARLQKLFPENVLLVDLEDPMISEAILDFLRKNCGVSVNNLSVTERNVGSTKDGAHNYPHPKFLSDV